MDASLFIFHGLHVLLYLCRGAIKVSQDNQIVQNYMEHRQSCGNI